MFKRIQAFSRSTAASLLMLLMFTNVPADPLPAQDCWGQATKVFAQTGAMGGHASQQPTPRLGLRNLARELYEAGILTDDSMQSLGAFVAAELGLSIDACVETTFQDPEASRKPTFVAPLSGLEEVPAVDTRARGQTVLTLDDGGTALHFKLIVANIEGVTQAHIHCGMAGTNGPVVAFLFGLMPLGVNINGIAAEGTITASDIIPRPDTPECPGGLANLEQLIEKIYSGGTYVNVHTLDNPGGEIRGQIR